MTILLIFLGILGLNFLIFNLHRLGIKYDMSKSDYLWQVLPIGVGAVLLLKLYDKAFLYFKFEEDLTFYVSFVVLLINFLLLKLMLNHFKKSVHKDQKVA